jgi:hypothetical protein
VLKSLWRTRFRELKPEHAFTLACLLTIGACFALHTQVAVENRFGLPILALASLFIPVTLGYWQKLGRFKPVAIASFLALIGAGCVLSDWIQSLAEPIVRAWGG